MPIAGLTCTAQTTTSSLLVAIPSTLTVAAPLVTIECTTHRHGNLCNAEEFFSSEIIIVNSELTISFFPETSLEMASNNNNNLTTSVPIFTGSDFWVWEQKMGDYLNSQRLWHFVRGGTFVCPVEAIAGQPMAAELQAQMDWDGSNL